MKTQQINNQISMTKKFRVPITLITRTAEDVNYTRSIRKSGFVKEYSNPDAEAIYQKMQQTRDVYEKSELDKQMGDYEIKPMNWKEKILYFLSVI